MESWGELANPRDLGKLFDAWGVKYDAGVVAACVNLVEEGFSFTP